MSRTIAIVGLGALGRQIALQIAVSHRSVRLVMAGRREAAGRQFAFLLGACHGVDAHFTAIDALDTDCLARFFAADPPDVIVQAASLLSPWWLPSRHDEISRCLLGAGFGLQLPAQLPVAMSVMRAAKVVRASIPVVNCSYPDVVNPILRCLDLCPKLGVGNGGMVEAIVKETIRRRGSGERATPLVRVIAHHAHVTPAVRADPSLCRDKPKPKVFLGVEGTRHDGVAFEGTPLPSDRDLNVLTAAHARRIILALLDLEEDLRTTAPGPLGLPGGYPVRIRQGEVTLDLPDGESLDDAIAHNQASASLDGIEHVSTDGTVVFTREAQQGLPPTHAELLAPLAADDAWSRWQLLVRLAGCHSERGRAHPTRG